MSYSLKIAMDYVICRDTESLNGRDYFALMGGVIVDGAWVPFVLDPISITPTMGRQSFNNDVVFDGTMHNREIGLVLFGYDIDNNSAWKREREEITKTMDTMAKGVGFVPGIGKVAAAILSAWPRVVDGFVALDKNDLLLEHSQAITLPDVPFTLTNGTAHRIEVRFKGANPPIYSDWDYSLYIFFGYTNHDVPSFGGGPRPEYTRHARKNSKTQEWVGTWLSDRVRCEITRATLGGDLLDVHVTESGRGGSVQINVDTVAITQPVDVRVLEQGPRLADVVGGHGKPTPKRKLSATEQAIKGTGVPRVAKRMAGAELAVKVPQRQPTGADRLMLSNDTALEIYALHDRGQLTTQRELRYVRPYTKPAAVVALQVDEYLQWSSMG